jgi:hypothetical protein
LLILLAHSPVLRAQTREADLQGPPPKVRLEIVRETTDLGPRDRTAIYRVAVCPAGTAYLTDAKGRLVSFDERGAVSADTSSADWEGVVALACDAERLYAAAPGRLIVARNRPNPVQRATRTFPLNVRVVAMASTSAGLVAVGTQDEPPAILHSLSFDGEVTESYGDVGPGVEPAPSSALTTASVIVDSRKGRVIFVPSSRYEFHTYVKSRRTGIRQRTGANFLERKIGPQGPGAGDSVFRAIQLSDGRFVTQIYKRWETRPHVWKTRSYVEVLGPDFELIASDLKPPGLLQGSDATGNLYFSAINPSGAKLVVARLVTD